MVAIRTLDSQAKLSVVISYTMIRDEDGTPTLGKFNSVRLMSTSSKLLIKPDQIIKKVSLAHECGPGCTFLETEKDVREEREMVRKTLYVYKHDDANNVYLVNRFHLGEIWKYCT